MPKSLLTVRISDDAQAILKKLCEEDERTKGYIIEKLILEAGKNLGKTKTKK